MAEKQTAADKTCNGSFTFKGEGAYEAAQLFLTWCEELTKSVNVELISNRVDYNSPRLKE